MSITTQKGDDGLCDMMYGRRVSKSDPRVAACGAIDELTATIGVARVSTGREATREALAEFQGELILLMGELMTLEEDRERFFKDGHKAATADMVDRLTRRVEELEKGEGIRFTDWVVPGEKGSLPSAHLDVCRATCRRAERARVEGVESGGLPNPEILRYFNRLSDVLWLLARAEEK
jgi:cob(I)alamin adenosyltransferase